MKTLAIITACLCLIVTLLVLETKWSNLQQSTFNVRVKTQISQQQAKTALAEQ